jgi:putative membrane protein
LDRRLPRIALPPDGSVTARLLLGVGLYYGVLAFNLGVTFWIGEPLLGMTGLLMYVPVTALLVLRLVRLLPPPHEHSTP